MTKLYKAFNQTLLQFLLQLRKVFPKEVGLQQEVVQYQMFYQQDNFCHSIFDMFDKDMKEFRDMVFKQEADVLTKSPFFVRIGMKNMYDGFDETEKEVFWKGITNLVRYTAMLKACGTQLDSMEGMATSFMEKNPDLKPEEYHSALFKEMLSGGSMSQQLLKTFEKPEAIENILKNVGDILRGPKNEESLDLSSLTKLVKGEGVEELDMQKDFKQMQEIMRAGGFQIPEAEEEEDEKK